MFRKIYIFFFLALFAVTYSMCLWFRDIIVEGTYRGYHTLAVQKGIYIGVALFIVSEVFFFFAIFWAYFHSSLGPEIEIGTQWPPVGIQVINPFELPLLNTILLSFNNKYILAKNTIKDVIQGISIYRYILQVKIFHATLVLNSAFIICIFNNHVVQILSKIHLYL